MKQYTILISTKGWQNGSGWSYNSILDRYETDDIDEIAEIDRGLTDWSAVMGFDDAADEYITKTADDSREDTRYIITAYLTEEYQENPCEAREIVHEEKWASEEAKRILGILI